MSKRTLEELKQEVSKALKFSDAAILMQCAKELKEIGTSKARALCENTFGVANQISGNYREALEHHLKALNLLEELGDRYGVGRTNNSIGNVYSNTGNYPLALEYFHRALALSEDLGDRPGVANVNINLGDLYKRTGHYPQALEHHHRAVALYEELGSRFGVEMATCNIGAIYAEAGSFQQALEFYYRALAMREELGDTRGAAVVTFNIIQALINIASYAEAEALLASMETIQIDNPQVIVVREMSRAAIQEHYEKFDDAMNTLITALETAREHSLARERADIHQQIRDLCQKRNDFAGYIIHNNEFTRIQEEINGRETAIKFTMQEKQREIDAREKEHQKFMAVLHSTLPKHIADRVARGEQVTDHIDDAAVMFVDIVGFTALSSTLTNQQVISLLDALFGICDEACKKNNVTRIKTIGDSYLAVAFPSTTVERDSEANIAGERDSLIETVLK
ncbi:MAG: tetratricopeptide repeat protein, partial [Ignavibacteria bacterium]|nr:tetratricopeptide repeat protein [Ignavibacteria bacterium]